MPESADATTLVGREIVAEIAPEELALFDYFARRYRESASADLAFLSREERQGGLGLPGSEVVVTYLVLALVQPVVKAVAEGALEGLKETSRETVKSLLKPYAGQLAARLHSLVPAGRKDRKISALQAYVGELEGPEKQSAGQP